MRPGPSSQHRRNRALAVERLEVRAVPAASPLHVWLDVGSLPYVEAAALLPDGRIRIAGGKHGIDGTAWDFDQTGQRVAQTELGELPGVRFEPFPKAISPNGRWLAGIQYDHDPTPGHLGRARLSRWDGENLESPVEIDISSIEYQSAQVVDVANNGDVLLSGPNYSYFRWNPTSGVVRLEPLSIENADSRFTPQASARAISGDGSVIVGASNHHPFSRPTIWTSAGPQFLETGGRNGSAYAIADDGRIVGGSITDQQKSSAVVWADGTMVQLRDQQGNLVEGSVMTVVNALGGDPTRWAAFGGSRGGLAWIALSDGVAYPLHEWLRQRYEIIISPLDDVMFSQTTGIGVLGAFVYDDALQIVTTSFLPTGMTSISPSIFYAQTSPRLIVAPLTDQGEPTSDHPLDIDQDGSVTPSDALIIINLLNNGAGGPISDLPDIVAAFPRIDTNADGHLSPADALAVIDWLNPVLPTQGLIVVNPDSYQSRILPGFSVLVSEPEPGPMAIENEVLVSAADELYYELGTGRRTKTTL